MIERKVCFNSTDGIQQFIRIVGHFPVDIDIKFGSYVVDGKSILGILSLGTHKDLTMTILDDNCEELLEKLTPFIIKS